MNKPQIVDLINQKHDALFQWLQNHDGSKWEKGPEGKWTTGQHIKHLHQSMQPLNKVLKVPKMFLSYKFGVSNRATRSYDELVSKYQSKVHQMDGVVSPYSKNLTVPMLSEKATLINMLNDEKEIMLKKFDKWNEPNLDKYIVPHPLLGRMPFREMFMFMGYHTEHHHKILAKKY